MEMINLSNRTWKLKTPKYWKWPNAYLPKWNYIFVHVCIFNVSQFDLFFSMTSMSVQKRAQLLYQECFSYLKRAQSLLENVSVFHTLSLWCMWHTATDSSWFWYFTGHFSADGTGSWSGQEHDGGSGGHWADEDVSRWFTERRSSQWKHRSQVSVWLSVCVCDINKQNLLTLACSPAHFEYMSVTRNILWRLLSKNGCFVNDTCFWNRELENTLT